MKQQDPTPPLKHIPLSPAMRKRLTECTEKHDKFRPLMQELAAAALSARKQERLRYEAQLLFMLTLEHNRKRPRRSILRALHTRYSAVRQAREWEGIEVTDE